MLLGVAVSSFIARDLLLMLAEVETHLPLDDGIHQ